ncbi:MAG: DUF190 domain-containing protein [bacterium]
MMIEGAGKLLRVFVGETDRYKGVALCDAIVLKARELGLAGATAWKGMAGFGAHSRIHTAKVLSLSEDLPIIIEIVDSEEKIRALLPELDTMMEASGSGGLVTLESAEVIRYPRESA